MTVHFQWKIFNFISKDGDFDVREFFLYRYHPLEVILFKTCQTLNMNTSFSENLKFDWSCCRILRKGVFLTIRLKYLLIIYAIKYYKKVNGKLTRK